MNMTGNQALYAAYAVTWLIHIGYIIYLTSRSRRIADEVKDLERTSQRRTDETR